MNVLEKIRKAYFLGIGGIGMSALARHFNSQGVKVYGYDKVETMLTKQLEKEGMKINYEDIVENIPAGIELAVYTPAIPKDHRQFNYILERKLPLKKRSEVLQELTRDKFTIAVSGAHGKTSVTTLIAHVLKHAAYDCTAFLGGISVNYNTNYISGKNNVVVVEADEFDRSFLRLNPDIAVITAIDTDHLDIYGSLENIQEAFDEFAEKVKPEGVIVAQSKVALKKNSRKLVRYGFSDTSADYQIANVSVDEQGCTFDISGFDGNAGMTLIAGGSHNVENALAAYCVARQLGIAKEKVKDAIAEFRGVRRRFEHIIKTSRLIYIDDYAHHPEEIRALLEAVKTIYPGKKITAVFQPHLYSRTKDLCEGFAKSLDKADEVILLGIYPAREKPIPGVTSGLIAKSMKNQNVKLMSKEELLPYLKNRTPEVILTIGAGDIDTLVEPIRKMLSGH
jgi:UDP-N-acetylmuramate--alanine ligase